MSISSESKDYLKKIIDELQEKKQILQKDIDELQDRLEPLLLEKANVVAKIHAIKEDVK